MRTVAYFDVFTGVAGDMALGALVDAGLPLESLQEGIQALGLPGLRVEAETAEKQGIRGTKVHVRMPHEHVHRGLSDILRIVEAAELPRAVQAGASRVFERLAAAEAEVHGVSVDDVHFHEVGALDAIADVVGTVHGLHELGVDEVRCSPIPLSTGFVECAHGTFPVPPPAVGALLRGVPVRGSEIDGETVTPTGAALMVGLATGFGAAPEMTIRRVGYGAGDRDFDTPNLLRVLIGESGSSAQAVVETLVLLEANVDDMTPEWLGPLLSQLLEAGALDAWFTPIIMKKGRPAQVISALAAPASAERIRALVFSNTTTLGIRETTLARRSLERKVVTVETAFGTVRVKVARLGGDRLKASPEFDDCLAAAERHGVSVQTVHQAAVRAWSPE